MIDRPRIENESAIIKSRILCFLHYRFVHGSIIEFTLSEIMKALKEDRYGMILYACEQLLDDSEIDREHGKYSINSLGISLVENWSDDLYQGVSIGIDFLEEPRKLENEWSFEEDAKNDDWTPLNIDRDTALFKEAVSSAEEALATISGDNGYAATEPDERNQVVWSLTEGLSALKERMPTRAQVRSLIVGPLRFVATKFAGTIIGEAGKKAWPIIVKWLASL